MKRTLVRAFAEATPDPVLVLDHRARVLEFSPPAADLLPEARQEARDVFLRQVFDLPEDIERDIIERGLSCKSPSPVRLVPGARSALERPLHGEVWRLGGDRNSWVGLRLNARAPQIEALGELTERLDRVTNALRERDIALQSLRAKEEEARRIEAAARIGFWRCSRGEGVLRLSEQARRLVCPGSDEENLSIAAYVELAHYADQDRLLTFFKQLGSDPVSAEIEHGVVVEANGESIARTVWLRVEPEYDQDGAFRGHLGFVQDISEIHQARKELDEVQRLRAMNERILDAVGEGIFGLSTEGKTTFVNPAAEQILGWDAREMLGKSQHKLIHHTRPDGSTFPQSECPISATLADKKIRYVEDDVFWRKDGTSLPVSYTAAPLSMNGKVSGAVVSFRDNSRRVARERAMREARDRLAKERDRAARERNLLLSLGRRLIDAEDLDKVPRVALTCISKYLYGQDAYAEAWLANQDGEPAWSLDETWVGDPDRFQTFRNATLDIARSRLPTLVARAVAAGSPQWIEDVSGVTTEEFARADAARSCDLRTVFALPVLGRDECRAVLVFALPECRADDRHFVELIEGVADQVSAAMSAKLAERELKDSEQRFRTIVENLPVPLVISSKDRSGEVFFNRPAEKLVHDLPNAAEPSGGSLRYAEPGARQKLWATLTEKGELDRYPVEFQCRDGGTIEAEVTSKPLTFAGRDAFCTIIMDMTEARFLARNLHARNRDLKETQRAARIGQWNWRQNDPGAEISAETANLLGLDPGREFYSVDDLMTCIAPSDRVRVRRAFSNLFQKAEPLSIRHGTLTDGQVIHMRGQPETDAAGAVVRVHGFVQDVSELAQAHERLRNDRHFLETLLDNLDESIIACDASGRFRLFNKVAEKIHGPLRLGGTIRDLPDDGEVFAADGKTPLLASELPLSRAFRNGDQVRDQLLVIRNQDQTETRLICNAQPIMDEAGRNLGAVVVQRDVSEQHALETAARQREVDFERMFNATRDGTLIVRQDGTILEANKAACEMHGFQPGELNGVHASSLVLPGYADKFTGFLERTQSGEAYFVEAKGVRKDGAEFPVEVVGAPIKLRGEPLSIATVRDITSRKQLEAQVVQAQRMEAVAQLTGGVAHDFNNLLQAIMMNLDFLQYGAAEPEEMRHILEMTVDTVEKCAQVTQQMLAFSRRQTLAPKRADINSIVSGMLPLLQRSVGEAIEIDWRPSGGAAEVLLDPVQFESMLLNLAVNARDAMPKGGRLEIACSIFELSRTGRDERAAYIPEQADLAVGPYVRVTVRDTGTGIAPDLLEKVFEPFFTTKEVGKGSGLGLAMAFGFVRQSNGFITVESEEGEGTEFQVHFPLYRGTLESQTTAARESKKSELPRGAEKILVVDDNDAVRNSVELRLQSLGYGVVSARDVNEALERLEEDSHIKLVFSDIVMPGGRSGTDLAQVVHEKFPRTAVILTSGFGGQALQGLDGSQLEILQKPYRTKELAIRIRQALDRRQDEI